MQCCKRPLVGAFYSITSAARASADGGTVGGLSEPIFVAASERGLESGCWGFVLNEGGVSAETVCVECSDRSWPVTDWSFE